MKTMLQTICAVMIAFGICIELYYGSHIGFILITSGSLAFALSTKIDERVKKSSCKEVRVNADTKD